MTRNPAGAPTLASVQIVVGALAAGLTVFAGVAAFLGPSASPAGAPRTWTLLVAGFTVANLIAVTLVTRLSVVRARQRYLAGLLSRDRLLGEFLILSLLRGALVEAPGLFGCVAYIVGAVPVGLPVALACVIALLALVFPTRGRFESYSEAVTRPE